MTPAFIADLYCEKPAYREWFSKINRESSLAELIKNSIPVGQTNWCGCQKIVWSIAILSKKTMTQYNQRYRAQAKPTNVLSLLTEPYDEFLARTDDGIWYPGDLLLCPEVIEMEALAQKKTLRNHAIHLLIHGSLHLLGYDHEQEDDQMMMEQCEINLLAKLGISNPYVVSD